MIPRQAEVLPGVFEAKETCDLAGREALSKLWTGTRQRGRDGIQVIMQESRDSGGVLRMWETYM